MRIHLPLLASLLCVLPFTASAHPHAWISVRTTVILNDKNEAIAIREHWLFDKMYSAFAARDLNPKGDGKFKNDELIPLAQQNLENLSAFHYFTVFEKEPQHPITLGKPENIASMFEDAPATEKKKVVVYATPNGASADDVPPDAKQIAMEFTLPLAAPVSLASGKVTYRIFDPTYYVDMTHYEQAPVAFARQGSMDPITSCNGKVELPKIDSAMMLRAAALDKSAKAQEDYGYYFSEKVTLSCS
ncbi:MAG: DUF1007 family protein [Alphaproteobacteria bacterium]|nr:DUF1007 family protein [Alphaproteobacteria bacterium]MBV8548571.1 DUF1007 family protein [Alphaproteobacteria bacterium]